MIKILIVDDNKIERESLRESIDWDSVGACISADASNGIAALECILKEPPDILITDIKMPCMGGIELAQKALRLYPKLKVIFLTGFEEFELARNAVNIHASGYIVKPVSTSEFYDVLKRVIDETIETNLHLEKEKNLKRQLVETLPILKDKFIFDLLSGCETADETSLNQKAEFLGIYLHSCDFEVLVVHIDDYETAFLPLPEHEKQDIIQQASAIITSLASPFCRNFFITSSSHYQYGHELAIIMNLINPVQNDKPDCQHELNAVCRSILDRISSACGISMTIGISNHSKEIADIPMLYQQALTASGFKFFKGKGNIIQYSDVFITTDQAGFSTRFFETEITRLLKAGDIAPINLLIDDIFRQIDENHLSVKSIRSIFMDFVYAVKRMLAESGDDAGSIIQATSLIGDQLQRLETIHAFRDCIADICCSVLSFYADRRKDIQTVRVERVIELMNMNIENNITVDEIARQVFLTPNYLRLIFKEKTGENLLEYFTMLKMEHAKTLLANSGLKINEVAKRVGYESASYFCSVFKSLTGNTPKFYKDNLIKLQNSGSSVISVQ